MESIGREVLDLATTLILNIVIFVSALNDREDFKIPARMLDGLID